MVSPHLVEYPEFRSALRDDGEWSPTVEAKWMIASSRYDFVAPSDVSPTMNCRCPAWFQSITYRPSVYTTPTLPRPLALMGLLFCFATVFPGARAAATTRGADGELKPGRTAVESWLAELSDAVSSEFSSATCGSSPVTLGFVSGCSTMAGTSATGASPIAMPVIVGFCSSVII